MKLCETIKQVGTFMALLGFLLVACEPLQAPPPQIEATFPVAGPTPLSPVTTSGETQNPTYGSTPLPAPVSPGEACFTASPALPGGFRDALQDAASFCPDDSPNKAATAVVDASVPYSRWVYVLVARFPTITDGISLAELQGFNKSNTGLPFNRLLVASEDLAAFEAWEALQTLPLEGVPASEIIEKLWQEPNTWALVPFEALEPRLKVLDIDGTSPLDPDFDPETWPLSMPIGLQKAYNAADDALLQQFADQFPHNWQPNQLVNVTITGVTALARATAVDMERYGVLYPQEAVGDTLRAADLLHVSNEVSFAVNCPDPVGIMPNLIFCSKERYFRLIEDIGTDVVELTGDHLNDWGPEALANTLRIYQEAGLPFYGGGANAEEAAKPATFEIKGNKIAFVGCNAKGTYSANAGATTGGANPCDLQAMATQVHALKEEGFNVIATFQHYEGYAWYPEPAIVEDFALLAEAGASIVSGSQAHRPHSMAFSSDGQAMLRYGLGNLFFDQLDVGNDSDKGFIDQHFFYGNRHISTRLVPIYFTDYSQPKFAPPEVATPLLETMFSVSGW